MKNLLIVRNGGIILLFMALALLSSVNFKTIFVSMLFAHYFLSFIYAKNKVQLLAREKSTWIPVAVLILLSFFYFMSGIFKPAQVLFTILHIALSDTYMANDLMSSEFTKLSETIKRNLNFSRFILSASCFILAFNDYPIVKGIPTIGVQIAIVLSICLLIVIFAKNKISIRLPFALYEASMLIPCCLIYFLNIKAPVQYLVFYHVAVWIIFPVLNFNRQNKKAETQQYLSWFLISSVMFLGLRLINAGSITYSLDNQIPFWASVHFLSTLALSRYNPAFIENLFSAKIKRLSQSSS